MTNPVEEQVAHHYGRASLLNTILDALKESGADPDNLAPEELSPVDEFHTAGKATTRMALGKLTLSPEMHVLDLGCGIGGTARTLAVEHGCRVTGIDLTPEFIETAIALSERTGLADRCAFEQGSALDLPFDGASFDAAVTLHVAMNIENRDRLYKEVHRVLRPGAQFCVFDVMKGPTEGMVYPVPWAETEATSFLRSAEETKALLTDAGFTIEAEENLLQFAIDFFEANARRAAAGEVPHIGLQLLMGESAPQKFANYLTAAKAHQVEPVILIAKKN